MNCFDIQLKFSWPMRQAAGLQTDAEFVILSGNIMKAFMWMWRNQVDWGPCSCPQSAMLLSTCKGHGLSACRDSDSSVSPHYVSKTGVQNTKQSYNADHMFCRVPEIALTESTLIKGINYHQWSTVTMPTLLKESWHAPKTKVTPLGYLQLILIALLTLQPFATVVSKWDKK